MSSILSQTEHEDSIHTTTNSEAGDPEEGTDNESLQQPVVDSSVREVYLICDEDAREHEDAVELVNWSTFDEWKQPWHVVKLWEGSVYDEMTLWGSIPLQNDKLRKVTVKIDWFVYIRLYLIKFANIPNASDSIGFVISMSSLSKWCLKNDLHNDVPIKDIGMAHHSCFYPLTKRSVIQSV